MSENWWRAYNNSIHHRKLLKLSDAMHRAWYTLQCIASENGGDLPPADDIAVTLRIKDTKVAEWITYLVKADLYENVGGTFRPKNWDRRQYKTDATDPTGAKRAKSYRDRKRDERNASRGVTRDGAVSSERPEAEAESETEQSRADGRAPIDEDLKRKVAALQAGISAHFVSRQLKIPNLNRCHDWLADGIAAGTVLAAVEGVLKRGTKPATLDYFEGPVRDAHAKAPPAASPQLVSMQEFIIEGTLEWTCWDRYLRETTGRGSPVTDNRDEAGRFRRGWFRPTRVPPGYDEATGERIAPPESENAA